jgi:hypothetical protein
LYTAQTFCATKNFGSLELGVAAPNKATTDADRNGLVALTEKRIRRRLNPL